MTNNQQSCIERAKRYNKCSMNTKPIRQLYIEFCTDGYIGAEEFISLVTGKPVVLRFHKPDEKPIREFISYFEKWVLGKNRTEEEWRIKRLELERRFPL